MIRKTRIGLGLEVKQLTGFFGVDECSITNWEIGRNQPIRTHLKSIVGFLKPHLNGSIPEKELWKFCFKNDPFYPKQIDTFGDRLRIAIMQSFLSIKQLAKELNVDPTSIGKWERMESNPMPEYKDKIIDWIKLIKIDSSS